MKKLVLAALAFMVLSAGAVCVSAQKATRISFKKGSTTAVVTGTLSSYKSKRVFVIRVRDRQTLTTGNAGKNHITVSIEAPPGATYEQDMAADCHDRNEVKPTAAGDYRITVTECQKADRWKGSFKLRVAVGADSTAKQADPPNQTKKTHWRMSGEPIDTRPYDDAIQAAEKSSAKVRSKAYYKRADALTEARQYASALGDYRKAAKLDPSNTQAKEWVDMILNIYESLNIECPKEGEEPPALPFNK